VRRLPLVLVLLLASTPTSLLAQHRAAPLARWSPSIASPPAAAPLARGARDRAAGHDEIGLAFGGVLGFMSGAMVGGLAGTTLERSGCSSNGEDFCGLAGAVFGGLVGGGVGAALGVHWTDDREGRLDRVLLATGVVTAGGLAGFLLTNHGEILLLVPVAQIGVAVSTEKATAR
jgi:hypothetical protein